MAAKIFNIASHAVESVDKSVINLSEPSIVQLQFGPEDVRAFDRVGTNLKITLLDGKVIVLEDFFVHAADGERSELVLVDDEGVMWWGQYGEQWNGFHFAEIGDAPGGGSRFHFELQVERATERDLEPVFEEDERVEIDGGGRVVLVVDDEPQQRAIVCDLLDGYGFDTVAAADGHDALQQLERRHVDLIITDQYMDGMDGWNLLQAARTRRPGLPVLLYSSVPPQRPVDRGGRHEFDGHLLKPAAGSALLGTITRLLAKPMHTPMPAPSQAP